MSREFRRIVTTNDSNGKSEVLIDGPATNELASILTEMWVTDAGSHNHTDRLDHAMKSRSLEPPAGGTVFRFFRLPPMSAFEGVSKVAARATRCGSLRLDECDPHPPRRQQTSRHAPDADDGHIVLLSGKVWLVLDEEERDLEPFDVVVQRGTNHAWVNTGSEEALLMSVLVDDGSATER